MFGAPSTDSPAYNSVSDNTPDNTPDNTSDNTKSKEKEADSISIEQSQKPAEKQKSEKKSKQTQRTAGKQAGAKGHGRQVELEVTGVESHRACECAACGEELTLIRLFVARTGLYVLDVEVEELGLRVTHVKHYMAILIVLVVILREPNQGDVRCAKDGMSN